MHDNDEELITLAKMATTQVQDSLGKDLWPAASALSRVVELLAERVGDLTVEVRRGRAHDARAEHDAIQSPLERGVCTCGWSTEVDDHERVEGWIAKHLAVYADPAS